MSLIRLIPFSPLKLLPSEVSGLSEALALEVVASARLEALASEVLAVSEALALEVAALAPLKQEVVVYRVETPESFDGNLRLAASTAEAVAYRLRGVFFQEQFVGHLLVPVQCEAANRELERCPSWLSLRLPLVRCSKVVIARHEPSDFVLAFRLLVVTEITVYPNNLDARRHSKLEFYEVFFPWFDI